MNQSPPFSSGVNRQIVKKIGGGRAGRKSDGYRRRLFPSMPPKAKVPEKKKEVPVVVESPVSEPVVKVEPVVVQPKIIRGLFSLNNYLTNIVNQPSDLHIQQD